MNKLITKINNKTAYKFTFRNFILFLQLVALELNIHTVLPTFRLLRGKCISHKAEKATHTHARRNEERESNINRMINLNALQLKVIKEIIACA